MRSALALLLVGASVGACGCAHRPANRESMDTNQQILQTLRDPSADLAALLDAAARAPASEPATLWSGIADNPAYPPFHRGIAVYELLRRHLREGASLAQAAALFGGAGRAGWIDLAEIEKIELLGGEIPVVVPPGGSAFILRLPRAPADGAPELGAYLALDHDVDAVTLGAALRSRPTSIDPARVHIARFALFPASLEPPARR